MPETFDKVTGVRIIDVPANNAIAILPSMACRHNIFGYCPYCHGCEDD